MKTFLQVSILIDDEKKKAIKRMCFEKEKTMTDFITFLINGFIEDQKGKDLWKWDWEKKD